MLLHPYFLDHLVQERQANFRSEAAHEATVAEALRAKKVAIAQRVERHVRVVQAHAWSSHRPSVATRTDMAA